MLPPLAQIAVALGGYVRRDKTGPHIMPVARLQTEENKNDISTVHSKCVRWTLRQAAARFYSSCRSGT